MVERGPSVLVVDDTAENLRLLSTMLKERGYEVRPVTNGREALLAATSAPPEIVLLDVMMPEMDGYEVCRRLKSIDELREIPVIFLTALTDTTEKLKAFAAGGTDYITKPFQLEEVLARVNVHVELSRSRQKLRDSYERLRALERLREDLVQMVVHDMRSPLAVLTILLTFIQEHVELTPGSPIGEDVKDAISAATMAYRMANDVLDVSRLEEGALPLERARHDVIAICREVVKRMAVFAPKHQLVVDDTAELEASCDRAIVSRIVENLVSNGVKYSPAGGRVTLAATRAGPNVRISVRDEGRGVPAEARTRIFDKYSTVGGRNDQTFYSVGLGLAFCKLAVEAHGGTIGVEAAEPKGSLFWFELPPG